MIRYLGDCHGKYQEYLKVIENTDYSIQLGDFGFANSWQALNYSGPDHRFHKIIPGNHDDLSIALHSPWCLGNYGMMNLDSRDIFFIRGGLSIDRTYRVGEWLGSPGSYKTWWSAEELDFNQMMAAYELYCQHKPKILISHAAPSSIRDLIVGSNKSPNILTRFGFDLGFDENTALLLQKCLDYHRPKLHLFCHLHKSYDEVVDGCRFICLNELEYIDL